MWLTDFLAERYYHVSEALYSDRRKIWAAIALCFLAAIPITFMNGLLYREAGHWALNLLSAVLVVGTMVLFLLSSCVGTFQRLKQEEGVYRNHRIQEIVYSLCYTAAFSFCAGALVFFMYAIFFMQIAT